MHRRTIAVTAAALLLLTGCAPSGTTAAERDPSPAASQSPTKRWIESDEFKICRDLYASVPGSSQSPHRTCQAMAMEYDVDALIRDFGNPSSVEVMRSDLTAEVTALASPAPPPEVAAPAAPAPHVISDQARFVLDTNLGAGLDAAPSLKDQYCTMSDAALESTAGVLVGMYRDVTEADVIAYINEVCGR